MMINVSAEDIRDGNAAKNECPITLALRRTLNRPAISVSRNFIRYYKKRTGKLILIPLPKKAQDFLLDCGPSATTPFSFKLTKQAINKLKG